MAGDAGAWMENVKEYLEPVSKVALDVKDQVAVAMDTYNFPPAIIDAYKVGAAAVGVEDVNPVYVVGVSAIAAGVLFVACGCGTGPKKSKASSSRGKKKSKGKAKLASANGSSHKNGGVTMGNGGAGVGSTARGVPSSKANGGGAGGLNSTPAPIQGVKTAKKPAANAAQSQGKGKGKGKGKPAPKEAPPVITEEPEAVKKSLRTRKKKAAKEAKAAAVVAAAVATKKATGKKKGSGANGSAAAGGVGSRAGQNGPDAGVADPWGSQHAGGEWQTGPMGSQDGEWETVSHKKSKPRKERMAPDDANAIPGGLGL